MVSLIFPTLAFCGAFACPALGLHLRAPEFIPVLRYRLDLPSWSPNSTVLHCDIYLLSWWWACVQAKSNLFSELATFLYVDDQNAKNDKKVMKTHWKVPFSQCGLSCVLKPHISPAIQTCNLGPQFRHAIQAIASWATAIQTQPHK